MHGKPSAVLIATGDLEPLEETIAILSDPGAPSRLAASQAELARGEAESEEQLAQAMRDRRRQAAPSPLDERRSARRGTYRVISRIDDAERTVTVLDIAHRRDAYRVNG